MDGSQGESFLTMYVSVSKLGRLKCVCFCVCKLKIVVYFLRVGGGWGGGGVAMNLCSFLSFTQSSFAVCVLGKGGRGGGEGMCVY